MVEEMDVVQEIRNLTETYGAEIVQLRRHFHQYPELSWEEHKTADRLSAILREESVEVRNEVCGTGLVTEFSRGTGGRMIALRADMDALPLHDTKDVPYASRIPGVMHACGHDCHMAIAVGVVKVLTRLSADWQGGVRVIFQPSEETTPSGAAEMVKAGVMDGVDGIFAVHMAPEIPVGQIGLRAGLLTAHCNEFRLSVIGKSGHAARPHQAIDAAFITGRILPRLYAAVENRSNTLVPAVLSIGKIHGGTKANVIPERVEIAGSIRTIDERSRQEILDAIEAEAAQVTSQFGGNYELEFPPPVPSVYNDRALVELVRESGKQVLSASGIYDIPKMSMGGEDFSWFLTRSRGALVRLGSRRKGEEIRFLHSQDFDIDERALTIGVAVMTNTLLNALTKGEE